MHLDLETQPVRESLRARIRYLLLSTTQLTVHGTTELLQYALQTQRCGNTDADSLPNSAYHFVQAYMRIAIRSGFLDGGNHGIGLRCAILGLRSGLLYDVDRVALTIQHFGAFMYNAGMCRASFLTVACTALEVESRALDYVTAPENHRFDILAHNTGIVDYILGGAFPSEALWVDFVLLLQGDLGNSKLQRLHALPLTILTMSDDVTCLSYADFALPLNSRHPHLQYYFMEFCLYHYNRGGRRLTTVSLDSCCTAARDLLELN